jgi:hypothetical protein
MAHAVGTISLHLGAGGERIVDVRPDAARGRLSTVRLVDPCGFRMAVARAWADHEQGREIGLIGLGPSDELQIDWSVAAPGANLGFGAVRAVCAGRVVWAFASVLDPAELSAVLAGMSGEHDDVAEHVADDIVARLVHDELLGATVVHVEADQLTSFTSAAHPSVSTRVLDEVLRRMVAVVGAAETAGRPGRS